MDSTFFIYDFIYEFHDLPYDHVGFVLDNTRYWAVEILLPGADEEGLPAVVSPLPHLHVKMIN